MKAHLIENGVVVNTLEVDSLDALPGLVDASMGSRGDLYADGVFTPAPVVVPVPAAVTMRQARRALRQVGMYEAVNAAIVAMPGDAGVDARIDWEFSSEVLRQQPLVLALGPALGLNAAQLDALFVLAETL